MTTETDEIQAVREAFISNWGALGPQWGISRSMAQLHAALLVAPGPQSAEGLMESLGISRGNVSTNLRELVSWGLVRSVHVKGERREYFEAEKSVWKVFCTIARERKKREIEPALASLRECLAASEKFRSPQGAALHKLIAELTDFVALATSLLDRVSQRAQSQILPALIKLLR